MTGSQSCRLSSWSLRDLGPSHEPSWHKPEISDCARKQLLSGFDGDHNRAYSYWLLLLQLLLLLLTTTTTATTLQSLAPLPAPTTAATKVGTSRAPLHLAPVRISFLLLVLQVEGENRYAGRAECDAQPSNSRATKGHDL